VAGYLTYIAVAMPALLNLSGDCFYLSWTREATPSLNPFWLFIYFVMLIFVLAAI